MAEKLRLRSNGNGDVYLYVEDSTDASFAAGGDNATNVFAMNTSVSADVMPAGATANLTFAPGANGDVTLRPHGTGDTLFDTGDAQVVAGNLVIPTPNVGLTQGALFVSTNRFLHNFGVNNVFLGIGAGNTSHNIVTSANNVALGFNALPALTTNARGNIAIGHVAMFSSTTCQATTAVGPNALDSLITGDNNCAIGASSGTNLITGADNTFLGTGSGSLLTLADSSNVCISNDGTVGDNNTMRLGTQGAGAGQQDTTFIAGIHSVTPVNPGQQLVIIDNTGQMGSTAGGAFTTDTFSTDAGSAVPAAGIITMAGGSNLGSTGAGSTVTFNLDNTVSISGSMTAGTGLTATTGDITADAGDVVATAGDLEATSGLLVMPVTNTAIDEGAITLGGTRFMHARGTDNVFLGSGAGNATFTVAGCEFNVVAGQDALTAMATNCRNNVVLGRNAMTAATDSRGNVAIGFNSCIAQLTQLANTAVGQNTLTVATTGAGLNTAIGQGTLALVVTGDSNTALGTGAGGALTTSDSDNICIGHAGVVGDNNILRIGTQGTGAAQQDTTFIAGIVDVAVTNDGMVIIDSAGQLGSQVELVMPENPAFLAYNSVTDANVTGDATTFTVDFDTEVFDQGGDFAADTFTAPVTGRYQLNATVNVNGITTAMTTGNIIIATSNDSYRTGQLDVGNVLDGTSAAYQFSLSVLADMDAADTSTVTVALVGGALVADVVGGATTLFTNFSGYLAS